MNNQSMCPEAANQMPSPKYKLISLYNSAVERELANRSLPTNKDLGNNNSILDQQTQNEADPNQESANQMSRGGWTNERCGIKPELTNPGLANSSYRSLRRNHYWKKTMSVFSYCRSFLPPDNGSKNKSANIATSGEGDVMETHNSETNVALDSTTRASHQNSYSNSQAEIRQNGYYNSQTEIENPSQDILEDHESNSSLNSSSACDNSQSSDSFRRISLNHDPRPPKRATYHEDTTTEEAHDASGDTRSDANSQYVSMMDTEKSGSISWKSVISAASSQSHNREEFLNNCLRTTQSCRSTLEKPSHRRTKNRDSCKGRKSPSVRESIFHDVCKIRDEAVKKARHGQGKKEPHGRHRETHVVHKNERESHSNTRLRSADLCTVCQQPYTDHSDLILISPRLFRRSKRKIRLKRTRTVTASRSLYYRSGPRRGAHFIHFSVPATPFFVSNSADDQSNPNSENESPDDATSSGFTDHSRVRIRQFSGQLKAKLYELLGKLKSSVDPVYSRSQFTEDRARAEENEGTVSPIESVVYIENESGSKEGGRNDGRGTGSGVSVGLSEESLMTKTREESEKSEIACITDVEEEVAERASLLPDSDECREPCVLFTKETEEESVDEKKIDSTPGPINVFKKQQMKTASGLDRRVLAELAREIAQEKADGRNNAERSRSVLHQSSKTKRFRRKVEEKCKETLKRRLADCRMKAKGNQEQCEVEMGQDEVEMGQDEVEMGEGEVKMGQSAQGEVEVGQSAQDKVKMRQSAQGEVEVGQSAQGEVKMGQSAQGEVEVGQSAQGEVKMGQSAQGEVEVGQRAQGEVKLGQGEVRLGEGQIAQGEVKQEHSAQGEVKLGQNTQGEVKLVQSTQGEVKLGQSTQGEVKQDHSTEGEVKLGQRAQEEVEPEQMAKREVKKEQMAKCREKKEESAQGEVEPEQMAKYEVKKEHTAKCREKREQMAKCRDKIDQNAQDEVKIDQNAQDEGKIDQNAQDEVKIDQNAQDEVKIDQNAQDEVKIDQNAQDEEKIDQSAQDEVKIDQSAQDEEILEGNETELKMDIAAETGSAIRGVSGNQGSTTDVQGKVKATLETAQGENLAALSDVDQVSPQKKPPKLHVPGMAGLSPTPQARPIFLSDVLSWIPKKMPWDSSSSEDESDPDTPRAQHRVVKSLSSPRNVKPVPSSSYLKAPRRSPAPGSPKHDTGYIQQAKTMPFVHNVIDFFEQRAQSMGVTSTSFTSSVSEVWTTCHSADQKPSASPRSKIFHKKYSRQGKDRESRAFEGKDKESKLTEGKERESRLTRGSVVMRKSPDNVRGPKYCRVCKDVSPGSAVFVKQAKRTREREKKEKELAERKKLEDGEKSFNIWKKNKILAGQGETELENKEEEDWGEGRVGGEEGRVGGEEGRVGGEEGRVGGEEGRCVEAAGSWSGGLVLGKQLVGGAVQMLQEISLATLKEKVVEQMEDFSDKNVALGYKVPAGSEMFTTGEAFPVYLSNVTSLLGIDILTELTRKGSREDTDTSSDDPDTDTGTPRPASPVQFPNPRPYLKTKISASAPDVQLQPQFFDFSPLYSQVALADGSTRCEVKAKATVDVKTKDDGVSQLQDSIDTEERAPGSIDSKEPTLGSIDTEEPTPGSIDTEIPPEQNEVPITESYSKVFCKKYSREGKVRENLMLEKRQQSSKEDDDGGNKEKNEESLTPKSVSPAMSVFAKQGERRRQQEEKEKEFEQNYEQIFGYKISNFLDTEKDVCENVEGPETEEQKEEAADDVVGDVDESPDVVIVGRMPGGGGSFQESLEWMKRNPLTGNVLNILQGTPIESLSRRLVTQLENYGERNVPLKFSVPSTMELFQAPEAHPISVSRDTKDKVLSVLGLEPSEPTEPNLDALSKSDYGHLSGLTEYERAIVAGRSSLAQPGYPGFEHSPLRYDSRAEHQASTSQQASDCSSPLYKKFKECVSGYARPCSPEPAPWITFLHDQIKLLRGSTDKFEEVDDITEKVSSDDLSGSIKSGFSTGPYGKADGRLDGRQSSFGSGSRDERHQSFGSGTRDGRQHSFGSASKDERQQSIGPGSKDERQHSFGTASPERDLFRWAGRSRTEVVNEQHIPGTGTALTGITPTGTDSDSQLKQESVGGGIADGSLQLLPGGSILQGIVESILNFGKRNVPLQFEARRQQFLEMSPAAKPMYISRKVVDQALSYIGVSQAEICEESPPTPVPTPAKRDQSLKPVQTKVEVHKPNKTFDFETAEDIVTPETTDVPMYNGIGLVDSHRELTFCCPIVPLPRNRRARSKGAGKRREPRCSICSGVRPGKASSSQSRIHPCRREPVCTCSRARRGRSQSDTWSSSELERTMQFFGGRKCDQSKMFKRKITLKNILNECAKCREWRKPAKAEPEVAEEVTEYKGCMKRIDNLCQFNEASRAGNEKVNETQSHKTETNDDLAPSDSWMDQFKEGSPCSIELDLPTKTRSYYTTWRTQKLQSDRSPIQKQPELRPNRIMYTTEPSLKGFPSRQNQNPTNNKPSTTARASRLTLPVSGDFNSSFYHPMKLNDHDILPGQPPAKGSPRKVFQFLTKSNQFDEKLMWETSSSSHTSNLTFQPKLLNRLSAGKQPLPTCRVGGIVTGSSRNRFSNFLNDSNVFVAEIIGRPKYGLSTSHARQSRQAVHAYTPHTYIPRTRTHRAHVHPSHTYITQNT